MSLHLIIVWWICIIYSAACRWHSFTVLYPFRLKTGQLWIFFWWLCLNDLKTLHTHNISTSTLNKCLTFQCNVLCPVLNVCHCSLLLSGDYETSFSGLSGSHQMFPESTVFLTHSPPQWQKARKGQREGNCHSLSLKPSTERYLESNWWSLYCACLSATKLTKAYSNWDLLYRDRHLCNSPEQHTQKHTLYVNDFFSHSPPLTVF